MRERFDVNSNLTEVANALRQSEARQATLNAQLQEESEYTQHLSSIITERLRVIFTESGTPDFDGKAILCKIEANVKRSVSRVVADRKKQGRGPEEARTGAIDKARVVADHYCLGDLTDAVLRHVDQTLEKVYGTKKQSPLVKLRAL